MNRRKVELYKGEEKQGEPQVQAGPCCPGMLRVLAPASQVLGGKQPVYHH